MNDKKKDSTDGDNHQEELMKIAAELGLDDSEENFIEKLKAISTVKLTQAEIKKNKKDKNK